MKIDAARAKAHVTLRPAFVKRRAAKPSLRVELEGRNYIGPDLPCNHMAFSDCMTSVS